MLPPLGPGQKLKRRSRVHAWTAGGSTSRTDASRVERIVAPASRRQRFRRRGRAASSDPLGTAPVVAAELPLPTSTSPASRPPPRGRPSRSRSRTGPAPSHDEGRGAGTFRSLSGSPPTRRVFEFGCRDGASPRVNPRFDAIRATSPHSNARFGIGHGICLQVRSCMEEKLRTSPWSS